jgi:NAD-dependent SIR2 family protein deacetylase
LEFFRFCPGCGRRFHVKLEGKKLVYVEREEGLEPSAGLYDRSRRVPVIVDVEGFLYRYKCTHCGHEWSEKHVEEHTEGYRAK